MNTKILFLLVGIGLAGCTKSTQPYSPPDTYIPYYVGDTRQIIFAFDSSTVLERIVGTVDRSDGLEVFLTERSYGTQPPETLYFALSNDYFVTTALDSSRHYPGNPFQEQRIAKAHPHDGDTWKQFVGTSDSLFFTAHHLDSVFTFAGTFMDAFAFTQTITDNGMSHDEGTVIFARNIGFAGTNVANQPYVRVSYVRVLGVEYGARWPARNSPSRLTSIWNGNERQLTGR